MLNLFIGVFAYTDLHGHAPYEGGWAGESNACCTCKRRTCCGTAYAVLIYHGRACLRMRRAIVTRWRCLSRLACRRDAVDYTSATKFVAAMNSSSSLFRCRSAVKNCHIYIYIYIYKKKETLWVSGKYIKKNCRAAGLELTTIAVCDNRAARRWRRKFKSGCTPIFLYVFSADPQRLFLLQ